MKRRYFKKITLFKKNKQMQMFGYDNLLFKTFNLPKKQKFKNICINFNLKKLIKMTQLPLVLISIQML